MKGRVLALSIVMLLMSVTLVQAGEVVFRNGDRLTGSFEGIREGTVLFRSELAGDVDIAPERVQKLSVDEDREMQTIKLVNGDVLTGRIRGMEKTHVIVETEVTGRVEIPVDRIEGTGDRESGQLRDRQGSERSEGASVEPDEEAEEESAEDSSSEVEAQPAGEKGVVILRDGDVISGRVKRLEEDQMIFEADAGGTLTIDRSTIETFASGDRVEMHLTDGAVVRDRLRSSNPGTVELAGEGGVRGQALEMSSIESINPPPPPGPEWSGSLSAGYTVTRGNSDTTAGNVDLSLRRDSERTKFRSGLNYQYATEETGEGEEQTTRDTLVGKTNLDYFVSERWFTYGMGRFRRDAVADLNARLNLGSGMGYEWLSTDALMLSTRGGLGWTYENFQGSVEDESAAAAHAGYEFEAHLNERLRFLHDTFCSNTLEELSEYTLSSSAELRSPISSIFYVSLKAMMDYDSDPAEDAENTDLTYMLGIGADF